MIVVNYNPVTLWWTLNCKLLAEQQPSFPGDHRDTEPPESISNSEVKSVIADDSVGFPHVKVGHYQVIILKKPNIRVGLFFVLKNHWIVT